MKHFLLLGIILLCTLQISGQNFDESTIGYTISVEKLQLGTASHNLARTVISYFEDKLYLYDYRNFNLYEIQESGDLNLIEHQAPDDSLRIFDGAHLGEELMLYDQGNSLVNCKGERIRLTTKSKFKQYPSSVDYANLRWSYINEDRFFISSLALSWPGWEKTKHLDEYYAHAYSVALYNRKGKTLALMAPYPKLFQEKKYLTYMDETWYCVDTTRDLIYIGHEAVATISTYDFQGNYIESTEKPSREFDAAQYGEIKSELDSRLYKVSYRIESPNFGRIISDSKNDLLLRFYSPPQNDTTNISPEYINALKLWLEDKSKSCLGPFEAESIQLKQMFRKPVELMVFKEGKHLGNIPVPMHYYDQYAGISPDGCFTFQSFDESGMVIYKLRINNILGER